MFADIEGRKRAVVEGALLLAVLLILGGIHFVVPESLKQTLAFSHERFAVYTLFTAAFVHSGDAHLFGNVVGYLLTTVYAYMLCVAVGERKWFWRTFAIFIVVLPILVSLSSYLVFSTWFPAVSPVSRGFSGVVAGFGGFLLVALSIYVQKQRSTQLGTVIGVSTFLVLMGIIDYIYAGRLRLVVWGLGASGIVLEVGSYVWEGEIDLNELERWQIAQDVVAVVLVFLVLGYVIVAMFPAEIAQNGSTTNIIAHAMGFLLGIGVSLANRRAIL